jgi:hypothetical protein
MGKNREFLAKTIFSQKIAEKIGKDWEKIVGQWKKSLV